MENGPKIGSRFKRLTRRAVIRQTSSFRHWITPDGAPGPTGEGGFPAEARRYRLYVGYICPWASRTLMARALKGLEEVIAVTVVAPALSKEGWQFGGYPGGRCRSALRRHLPPRTLHPRRSRFHRPRNSSCALGRKDGTIVNNESADIVRMLDTAFEGLVPSDLRLHPQELAADIDALNSRVYDQLNNGVYKAGFALTQAAYDEAVEGVFAMLDELETVCRMAAISCSEAASPKPISASSSP